MVWFKTKSRCNRCNGKYRFLRNLSFKAQVLAVLARAPKTLGVRNLSSRGSFYMRWAIPISWTGWCFVGLPRLIFAFFTLRIVIVSRVYIRRWDGALAEIQVARTRVSVSPRPFIKSPTTHFKRKRGTSLASLVKRVCLAYRADSPHTRQAVRYHK